jgi:hypothetical protein
LKDIPSPSHHARTPLLRLRAADVLAARDDTGDSSRPGFNSQNTTTAMLCGSADGPRPRTAGDVKQIGSPRPGILDVTPGACWFRLSQPVPSKFHDCKSGSATNRSIRRRQQESRTD